MVQPLERFTSRPGLGRRATEGAEGLSQAEQFVIQREQAERVRRGGNLFSDFDALLGVSRSPTGNPGFIRGEDDRVLSLSEVAGQEDIPLSDRERERISTFFSPRVTAQQQSVAEALAKRASAQGLAGGAVRGQLGDLATNFIAQNRAGAFGEVQGLVGQRFGDIVQQVNPFLQQVGGLRQAFGGGDIRSVLFASGGTVGDFRQFAQTGIDALAAVGLGADALAGVARARGIGFDNAGLTGAADIGAAFRQFINPGTQAFGRSLTQQGAGVLRTDGRFFAGRRERAGTFGRNIGRASQRVGAAEQLAGRVGSIVQDLGSEVAALSALGTAQINQFTGPQGGTTDAARRLASADFSQFRALPRALGLGQGVRTAQGQVAGAGGGLQFLAGNPLFRTIFGT